mgnify:CR=1 FL=1
MNPSLENSNINQERGPRRVCFSKFFFINDTKFEAQRTSSSNWM